LGTDFHTGMLDTRPRGAKV